MAKKTDLKFLLKNMKPKLASREFVFCTVKESEFAGIGMQALMVFREAEGVTIIMERGNADACSLPYSQVWALITLGVESDLMTVGFLAKITDKLAKGKTSVNAVSAYHHDHLFVPAKDAGKAMKLLEELAGKKGR